MSLKKRTIKVTNKNGLELIVSSLGATIIALKVPDKKGDLINVVLGLRNEADYQSEKYLNDCPCLGAVIGRIAGRVSKGYITIDNEKHEIYHEKGVHLHGGKEGFDKKIWNIETVENGDSSKIVLSYLSKDKEEGYPGNLKVITTYELTENNELKITLVAETDKTTHVNLTNHSYYNLDGEGTVLNHKLKLNCSNYLEVKKNLLPTGKINEVKGTKYNFLEEKIIGSNKFSEIDDTFIFDNNEQEIILKSDRSGIKMKISTNQPGVVVYTPPNLSHLDYLDGATYREYPAICFETQKFPDAPHHKHFPSTLLEVGEKYINKTVLKFEV